MEQQAFALKSALNSAAVPPEEKLNLLNSIKSDIKHYRVPNSCQRVIFDCLFSAISQQQHNSLVTSAFATLGHLIKRLKIQDPDARAIVEFAPSLLPALADRLRDSSDAHRIGASQALADIWPYCPADVERTIREDAIGSNHPRAKEAGMQWVVKMHEDADLHVKPFVSAMVACLEHSYGGVRNQARASIVTLFKNAVVVAKNDLAKQLDLHGVRQSIASPILTMIGHPSAPAAPTPFLPSRDVDLGASTRSFAESQHTFRDSMSDSTRAAAPSQDDASLAPVFVQSARELEDMCRAMEPDFQGRESEENWLQRDRHVTKLRCLTRGNAPSEYHEAYMAALKMLHEGILKAANSLRTTVATNGGMLVQELARTLGPALDSLVEKFLPSFIKASSATKTIFASQSANTADTIFQYVSYNIRLIQHISLAMQDKNKQTRGYATGWLRTIINKNEGSRSAFEHSGGLDLTEKCIKQGLVDADPKVKEGTRATYWTYARIWPDRAKIMMGALDSKVRIALERDSHNPDATATTFAASTNSRPSGTKSSLLREQIREQRAKARSGNLPPRPVTAAANPSPARTRSIPNLNGRVQLSSAPQGPFRIPSNLSVSSSATDKSSSSTTTRPALTGAVRRPVKRPEIPRPATADPYASRRLVRSETLVDTATPKRDSPRAMGPTISSIRAQRSVGRAVSPQTSVFGERTRPKSHHDEPDGIDSPDPAALENFTLVLPSSASTAMSATASSARRQRAVADKSRSIDSGVHLISDQSPPNGRLSPYRQGSPTADRLSRRASDEPEQFSARSSPRSASRRPASPARAGRQSPSPGSFGSPSRRGGSRNASPAGNGSGPEIVRQGSPLKMVTASAPSPVIGGPESDVKIYEDPFHGNENGTIKNVMCDKDSIEDGETTSPAAQVLGELPVNESNTRPMANDTPPDSNNNSPPQPGTEHVVIQSPDLSQASPPLSPQSKAEKLRSRKLMQSGIERLRARTLDNHGFRKLQELLRANEPSDLFGTESKRFNDFLGALCDYIGSVRTPDSGVGPKLVASHELKRQALIVIRGLLGNDHTVYRNWIKGGAWNQRCLSAALTARTSIEGLPIAIRDIELLAQQAFTACEFEQAVDTVSAFLDDDAGNVSADVPAGDKPDVVSCVPKSHPPAVALALALRTVDNAIRSSVDAHASYVHNNVQQRICHLLAPRLNHPEVDVRRAAIELATAVYASWSNSSSPQNGGSESHDALDGVASGDEDSDKAGFWNTLESAPGGLKEETRNLIVYYIARGQ